MGKYQTKLSAKEFQKGFTIIEVLLFTSLSALFLLIAVLGSGSIQRNTEFTLGMEEIEQIVDGVVSDLRNGVSVNPGNIGCDLGGSFTEAGTNAECILMGKVIDFGDIDSRNYRVYDIIGDREAEDLGSANLKVVSRGGSPIQREFQYKWGVEYAGSMNQEGFLGGVRMLGLFFDISKDYNTVIVPYAYNQSSTDNSVIRLVNPSDVSNLRSQNLGLCFDGPNDNRTAALIFAAGSRQVSSEVDYNADCEVVS